MVAIDSIPSEIRDILEQVPDPEIPVLSVVDLGVIRTCSVEGKVVTLTITPTYTGCPAMDQIRTDIQSALLEAGYLPRISTVWSPAWTTDWISEKGKQALKKYGIAPPQSAAMDRRALVHGEPVIPCPRCDSRNTKIISAFGSTPCKALLQCQSCLEPFDYFKCHL